MAKKLAKLLLSEAIGYALTLWKKSSERVIRSHLEPTTSWVDATDLLGRGVHVEKEYYVRTICFNRGGSEKLCLKTWNGYRCPSGG